MDAFVTSSKESVQRLHWESIWANAQGADNPLERCLSIIDVDCGNLSELGDTSDSKDLSNDDSSDTLDKRSRMGMCWEEYRQERIKKEKDFHNFMPRLSVTANTISSDLAFIMKEKTLKNKKESIHWPFWCQRAVTSRKQLMAGRPSKRQTTTAKPAVLGVNNRIFIGNSMHNTQE